MTDLQFPLRRDALSSDLDAFRDRLVVRILYLLTGLGLLALIGSLARGPVTGWHPLLWLHVGVYLVIVLAAALATRLSPRLKRWLLLGGLYVTGAAGVAAYGLLGAGSIILVLFCALSATLVNTRAGMAAIALSTLTLAAVGALVFFGSHRFDVDAAAYLYSASAWAFTAAVVLLAGVLSVFTAGSLLQSLQSRYDAQQRAMEMLDAIARNSPDILVLLDSAGKFIFISHTEAGYHAPAELVGRRMSDFAVPEDRRRLQAAIDQTLATAQKQRVEADYLDPAGRIHPYDIHLAPVMQNGRVAAISVIARDIDEQRATETALARSEERLRLCQRYAGIGAWDWDITTGALYWSEEIGHLLGYGEAVPETTYENFLKAIHPGDRQRVMDAVNACVQRDDPYEIEHRVVWPDGNVRWLLERGGAIRNAAGEPLRMLGIVQDITERRQAAKSLMESEELFREFAENTDDIFWVRDLRTNRMIYANPAYEKVWGRPCATLLENPLDFLDGVHPDDLDNVREGMQRQQRGEYFNRDYRIIRPDGQIRWVHVQAFPIRNSAGVVYRIGGLVRDVTRQQQLEAERLRHERAQVQTLVREVHHRIKNHLQGVVGLLDEYASRFTATAPLLNNAIMQIRSIAMAHGLQGQGVDAELHLCEIVPAVAQSVAATLDAPTAIEVRIEMDWSLRIADADTVPLALIFNELLVNCLKHRPPDIANRPVCLHLHEQQGIGRLTFTCPGARLPEPFDFEQGVGLGTGLELVKSLLPRAGATLTFRNDPDGVCCEMTLQAPVVLRGSRVPGNTC
jgi:PAS domain S-box-containing protein